MTTKMNYYEEILAFTLAYGIIILLPIIAVISHCIITKLWNKKTKQNKSIQ